MSALAFTSTGAKASVAPKLDSQVFGVESPNHELIKSAYVAYLANGRENLAKTKTRGEVSGGGKKPWRQKGTGRARFGSTRVPIWRKGGVAHGPTGNENYSHSITTGAKRGALRHALSTKVAAGSLVIVDSFETKSGKTKDAEAFLSKIGAKGQTLVVLDAPDLVFVRSMQNISRVKMVRPLALNIFDVMNADTIVLTKVAVEEVTQWLGGKA